MKILQYFEERKKVGYFGIKYLDDKLRGIIEGDLILIGARSGAGKSTISEMIAQHNATSGKRVVLFSLENFEGDSFVAKCYYLYKRYSGDYNLNLRDFASGDFNHNMDALERANKEAEKFFENIIMINRQKNFGLKELKDKMIKLVNEENIKLMIIDHLDYVDKDNPNTTDVSFVTELMRTIRDLQDEFKVAIIAISHLRKNAGGINAPVIPTVDEFIGSGNKVKESTVVIMLAPDEEPSVGTPDNIKPTWCSIQKLRMGGVDRKKGMILFDTKKGDYVDCYKEYIFEKGKRVEIL